MPGSLAPEEEINTWPEIARYLGISVREAQYREKSEGLPIRRVGGKTRVWALRSELDSWKLGTTVSGRQVQDSPAPAQDAVHPEVGRVASESPGPSRRVSRRRVLVGLAGSALAVGGAGLFLRSRSAPERAVLSGNLLTALDGLGRTMWTHRFSGLLQQFDDDVMRWRVQVADLTGDGKPGVLVVCSFPPESSTTFPARDELFYFGPYGTMQWSLPCKPDLVDHDGQPFESAWQYSHVLVCPTRNGQTLFASIKHLTRWPACVERVDARGRRNVQFANAGNIESLCRLPRADGDYIAIAGENNAFDRACVSFIGVDDSPSCAPVGGSPRYRYANAPAGAPRDYILFPTLELTLANSASYGHAKRVSYRGDTVIVDVDVVGPNTSLLYEFSDRPEPKVVMPSSNYPMVHRQFEERGLLRHPWTACPEIAKPMTLRRWDPAGGWRDQEISWRLPTNLV